jgi:hypothetical protein
MEVSIKPCSEKSLMAARRMTSFLDMALLNSGDNNRLSTQSNFILNNLEF